MPAWPVGGMRHGIAFVVQVHAQQFGDVGVVLDDQYALGGVHGTDCRAKRAAELSRLIEDSVMNRRGGTAHTAPHAKPNTPPAQHADPPRLDGAPTTGSTRWPCWCWWPAAGASTTRRRFFPFEFPKALTLGRLARRRAAVALRGDVAAGGQRPGLPGAEHRQRAGWPPSSSPLTLRGILADAKAALRGALAHSDPRHYNSVQRAAYLFVMLDIVVLVLSGLVLWKVGAVRACCATCWAATSSPAASTSSPWRAWSASWRCTWSWWRWCRAPCWPC